LLTIADFVEKLITPKNKNNLNLQSRKPNRLFYSKEEMMQLAALVKKNMIFLIADEVYEIYL
jgi:aspartate aminotransferase